MNYMQGNQKPMSSDEVYLDMCDRIVSMELEPGQKISENEMGEEYGVSRSVIRTVFTRLKQRSLVEIYPQRGTYISLIDLDFVSDVLFLRTAVEKAIITEAMTKLSNLDELIKQLEENMEQQSKLLDLEEYTEEFKQVDSDFHQIIVRSVHRDRVMDLMREPLIHISRWRNFDVNFDHRVPELVREHQQILDAIKSRDLGLAHARIENHLETISNISARAKKKFPQYFV